MNETWDHQFMATGIDRTGRIRSMARAHRLLMLEFNELSPVLMDRFITAGHLPSFERFRSESATFVTEAAETGDDLNPWVQWVTVHTGLGAADHGVRKLGTAGDLRAPTVADVVEESGGSTWQCGSMNVRPPAGERGCFLPDPWNVDADARPSSLERFFRIVASNVQEHTSVRRAMTTADYMRLGLFLTRHGLSSHAASHAVRQIVHERRGREGRWRRAEVLDDLQWDVFRWYFKRCRPRFATFFSNSTAHFQHLYWRDMDPTAFGGAPAAGDKNRQRSAAILDGYRSMDALLRRIVEWAGDDVTLVFCTALSQSANTDNDLDRDGFYRPIQLDVLTDRLCLASVKRTAPVMAEQFHLIFGDTGAAEAAAAALSEARIEGRSAFEARRNDTDVFVGCTIFGELPVDAVLELPSTQRAVPFHDLMYWSEAPRSGTHHPDGMLWIRGVDQVEGSDTRVPLTAVAPTLLGLLGIDPPPTMITPAVSGVVPAG